MPSIDPRDRYFDHALAVAPEDASSVGAAGDARLRDPSLAGFAAEERALTALAAEVRAWTPPDAAASLDRGAMLRRADFRLRTLHDGRARRNLELVALPYAAICYVESHGRSATARAERVTGYLRALTTTFEAELAAGWTPEPAAVEAFATEVLPDAVTGLHASGHRAAAEAYEGFARTIDNLAVHAREGGDALGADEVRYRLDNFGVSPADLLAARAAASLRDGRAELARMVPEGQTLNAYLTDAMAPPLAGDMVAFFTDRCRALTERVRDRLVPWPPDASIEVRVLPAPPGLAHGNWPCPLMDPDGRGAFLVSPDPTHHRLFWADVFAVHEAMPGHYLQSAWWQSAQGGGKGPHPVRFVALADDVAAASQDWGPMAMIEGWAVYAEELMRQDGYFTGTAAAASLISHAIRAVRVLVDLGLQTGTMTADEATALYVRETFMPEAWARAQIARHRRVPLQGLSYLAGRLALEDLEAEARAQAIPALEFRRRVLAEGPLAPSSLRERILRP